MKKKTPAPLTFEDRLNTAHAVAGAAVSMFEVAALDLEEAAVLKREVVDDITDELAALNARIEYLSAVRAEAEADEAKALAKAAQIRALVSA